MFDIMRDLHDCNHTKLLALGLQATACVTQPYCTETQCALMELQITSFV